MERVTMNKTDIYQLNENYKKNIVKEDYEEEELSEQILNMTAGEILKSLERRDSWLHDTIEKYLRQLMDEHKGSISMEEINGQRK